MLQNRDTLIEGVAISEDLVALGRKPVTMAELVVPFVNGVLKFNGEQDLVTLDDQMWKDHSEELSSQLAGNVPNELIPVQRVSSTVPVDAHAPAVSGAQSFDNRKVRHSYTNENLVSHMDASGLFPTCNSHVALSVEDSSRVSVIKHFSSIRWDVGEFGETPMPGAQACGRTIPSQAGTKVPGVCNEHVPTAKAKMCSELRRDTETPAEMIGALIDSHSLSDYTSKVTDCNTDYLKLITHQDANMKEVGDQRSVNQDAVVIPIINQCNLVVSNRSLQGLVKA